MTFKKKNIRFAMMHLAASGALTAIGTMPAMAQETASSAETPALQKIEITGSHIKRSDKETADNVQVISAAQIQESGKTTVADFLRTISANFASYNETFVNSNAPSPGGSGIALRGLSQKNTLVLLNGQRITNYGFAQNLEDTYVDLNIIPLNAVDHIDILKDGASSIYGSDAIAGVVNIVLKSDYQGKQADVQYGAAGGNSMATMQSSVTAGFGDLRNDGYNVMFAANVFHRDDLLASQRPLTAPADTRSYPGGSFNWATANAYTNNANATAPQSAFPNCGAIGYPGQTIPASLFPGNATGTVCGYNASNLLSIIPGSDRASIVGNGILKLSNSLTAFGDVFISSVETKTMLGGPVGLGAGSVAYNAATGGVSSVSNTLPVGNPSNPGTAPQAISYQFQSVGNQHYTVDSYTSRISGGLRGSLSADWDWQAVAGYSENNVGQTTYNAINVTALNAAIANGSYNFLNPALTPAGTAALRAQFEQASVAKLATFSAKASGTLFTLPAGPVQAAVGYEYRHESEDNQPDQLLQSGQILNAGATLVDGARGVNAVYGELEIPIAKSLTGNLALREEKYSDMGSNLSPKASVHWQPLESVALRGSYALGYLAPTLPEMSHATATYFTAVNDPIDPLGRPAEAVTDVVTGNPNLKAARSANLDLGIVLSPTKDISLTADYYRISVSNAVAETFAQNIVDNPAAYPGMTTRTAGGLLSYVVTPYENQYEVYTRGVDVDAKDVFHLDGGARFTAETNFTFVDHLDVNSTPGGPLQNYAGTDGWYWLSPLIGGGPVPRLRGALIGTWENPDWIIRGTSNFTSGYKEEGCIQYQFCGQGFGGASANTLASNVHSYTSFDLYAEYKGIKNWTLSASVSDLFNRVPPWDGGVGGVSLTLYDLSGRFINFRAAYQF